jgi:hypothetical protein
MREQVSVSPLLEIPQAGYYFTANFLWQMKRCRLC